MLPRLAYLPAALALASLASAQEFNIDFNTAAGSPSASYGAAAGQPGTWNSVPAVVSTTAVAPTPLVNTAGATTTVGVRLQAGGAFSSGYNGFGNWNWDNPSTTGDDGALMDDIVDVGGGYPTGPVSQVRVRINGLATKLYDIYTYSFAPDNYLPGNGGSPWQTNVEVIGSADGVQSVGALDWPAAGHTHLETYAKHTVLVTAGTPLDIFVTAGTPNLGFGSLNGIQIVESVPPPVNFCTSGTSTNGCAPLLAASVNPNVALNNNCLLSVANLEGQKTGLIFYGINNTSFVPQAWGSGSSFLCVKAPTQRTITLPTGGIAGLCDGSMLLDFGAYQLANPGALGQPFAAGNKVYAQAWYRDPPAPKTTNLSNGVELTFVP
jgi:hypothetical protein